MTTSDVGETDFAVIVYREEDHWEADALPAAVTADLDSFVQALRRQPSIELEAGAAPATATAKHAGETAV